MELENSTGAESLPQSGEQAGVVAPPQESPTADADAGRGGAVDAREESGFDAESADSGEADAEEAEPGGAGREGARYQSSAENAAIRAARIRARRDAEAAERARADEAIAGLTGLRNPYTNKPFSSMKELSEYNAKVLRAENERKARESGRSVEEIEEDEANRAFLTRLRQESERQSAEAAAASERQAFFERDVLDFVEKYPQFGVKELDALENNAQFRRFCGSRFGREPLAKLYGDYTALIGSAGNAALTKAAGKAGRSTGGGDGSATLLTPAQKAELDKWNAANPKLKMTAKEFLGR